MDRETGRQLFHMAVGLIALAVFLHFGRGFAIAVAFFTIITGTLLINLRLQGKRIPIVLWFEKRFERKDAPLPGWGSACYATGVLMLLATLSDVNGIAAAIFILAVGDGVSTILGRKGKIRIPYNKDKTAEGALAFFISSLPAYYFIGPLAIPLILLATLAETLPLLEDNLVIPAACLAFFLVV